jgi:hypothetical protein
LISREKLSQFAATKSATSVDAPARAFDLDGYLSKYGFEVLPRKPWQSHPGGWIYELTKCPFNFGHVGGSAAFTIVDGKPGFRCQHDGCRRKTIKDIVELYPPGTDDTEQKGDRALRSPENGSQRTQSQILIEIAAGAELFHTPGGEAFAFLDVCDHREVWPVRSNACRQWLTRAFYGRFGKPPGSQAVHDAVALLEAPRRDLIRASVKSSRASRLTPPIAFASICATKTGKP